MLPLRLEKPSESNPEVQVEGLKWVQKQWKARAVLGSAMTRNIGRIPSPRRHLHPGHLSLTNA
jgi:hypothetical protein